MKVSSYLLLCLYLFYAVISSFLFAFSAPGWSMAIVLVILCFPCYLINLILIAIEVIRHRSKKIEIGAFGFSIVLLIQGLAVMTNTGDYGDAPGTYYFLEEFWKSLLPDDFLYSPNYLSLSFSLKILYAIALTIGVIKILWFSKSAQRK